MAPCFLFSLNTYINGENQRVRLDAHSIDRCFKYTPYAVGLNSIVNRVLTLAQAQKTLSSHSNEPADQMTFGSRRSLWISARRRGPFYCE